MGAVKVVKSFSVSSGKKKKWSDFMSSVEKKQTHQTLIAAYFPLGNILKL